MRSAIELVGVAGQWGFDTRPESLLAFAPSPTAEREVRRRGIAQRSPSAHHPQTLLPLCAAWNIIALFFPHFLYSFTNITSTPLFTSARVALPEPLTHSLTNRCASVFKLWPFRHCSGILVWSRPSAGSLPLLPRPSGSGIPFLSLRDSILLAGVSVPPVQDDHPSRRSARADLRILLRPTQSSRKQPSTRAIAIVQCDQWQEEL